MNKEQAEFYVFANQLLQYRYPEVGMVQMETFATDIEFWDYRSPQMNSGRNYKKDGKPVDKGSIKNELISENFLSEKDVAYILNLSASKKIWKLDSIQLQIPILSKLRLSKELHKRKNPELWLTQQYGSSCYLIFSQPIFNEDITKAILTIEKNCGPKDGYGEILFLTKQNGSWTIRRNWKTWVS
ncbi:hypothetical protein [Dyadobacter psychrotolerans]|nr:hypothetical protein [Dyadobacter psychrotolerans]